MRGTRRTSRATTTRRRCQSERKAADCSQQPNRAARRRYSPAEDRHEVVLDMGRGHRFFPPPLLTRSSFLARQHTHVCVFVFGVGGALCGQHF
jgi:hypothetical protein